MCAAAGSDALVHLPVGRGGVAGLPTDGELGNALRMSDISFLSTRAISPRDRLIFALDVPTKAEALDWIDRLGDAVTFYKLGLEFCMSGQYFEVLAEVPRRGREGLASF